MSRQEIVDETRGRDQLIRHEISDSGDADFSSSRDLTPLDRDLANNDAAVINMGDRVIVLEPAVVGILYGNEHADDYVRGRAVGREAELHVLEANRLGRDLRLLRFEDSQ